MEVCEVEVEDDITKVTCNTRKQANGFHETFGEFVKEEFTMKPSTHRGKEKTAIMVGKNWPDEELFVKLKERIKKQDEKLR